MIFTIPDPPLHRDRWTNEMLSRIARRYNVAEVVGNTIVYRPKLKIEDRR